MKIRVYVRDGIVICVQTSEPVEDVTIIDYDIESTDHDDLEMFPNPEGKEEECYVYIGDVHEVNENMK